jgi:hypothetical protein
MRSFRRRLYVIAVLAASVAYGLRQTVAAAEPGKRPTIGYSSASGAEREVASFSAFISPDFCGAAVIHPSQLAKSPIFAPLLPVTDLQLLSSMGPDTGAGRLIRTLDPTTIRRLVLVIDPFPSQGAPLKTFAPGVIIQFEAQGKPKDFLEQVLKPFGVVQKGDFQGREYDKAEVETPTGKVTIAAHLADDRAVLVAPEPTMRKMLDRKAGKGLLLDELRRQDFSNEVVALLLAEPIMPGLERFMGKPFAEAIVDDKNLPAWVKLFLPDLKSAVAALNFSGGTFIRLRIGAANRASANRLREFAELFVGHMKDLQRELTKRGPIGRTELDQALFDLNAAIWERMEVTQNADQVVVEATMSPRLSDQCKRVVAIVKRTGKDGGQRGNDRAEPDDAPQVFEHRAKPAEKSQQPR